MGMRLMNQLFQAGVSIKLVDGKLKIEPQQNHDVLVKIRERKSEIVAYLESLTNVATPDTKNDLARVNDVPANCVDPDSVSAKLVYDTAAQVMGLLPIGSPDRQLLFYSMARKRDGAFPVDLAFLTTQIYRRRPTWANRDKIQPCSRCDFGTFWFDPSDLAMCERCYPPVGKPSRRIDIPVRSGSAGATQRGVL